MRVVELPERIRGKRLGHVRSLTWASEEFAKEINSTHQLATEPAETPREEDSSGLTKSTNQEPMRN